MMRERWLHMRGCGAESSMSQVEMELSIQLLISSIANKRPTSK